MGNEKTQINMQQLQALSTGVKLASLLPIFVVIIIAALSFFFVKPMYARYDANRKAIAAERIELETLKVKSKMLKNLNEESLRTRLSEVQKALPEEKSIPGVIYGLLRITQENSLNVTALQIKPGKIAKDPSQQSEVIIKMSVEGDVRNLDAFLKRMQEVRRFLGIQKLNGTNSLAADGLVTSMELVLYTLALPDTLPGVAEALPDLSEAKLKLADDQAAKPVYTDLNDSGLFLLPSPSPTAVAIPVTTSSTPRATVRPTTTP